MLFIHFFFNRDWTLLYHLPCIYQSYFIPDLDLLVFPLYNGVYNFMFPLLYLLSILHVMLSTYQFSLVSLLIHALYIDIFLGLASFFLVDTTYIYRSMA